MSGVALPLRRTRLAALACAGLLWLPAQAHRPWLLPSATLVDGPAPVVSIDGAISEDLFEFDGFALPVDTLRVTAPDGSTVAPEARTATRRRVSFDVTLARPGSYRVAALSDTVMATWTADGQPRRWRGAPAALAGAVPADARDLQVTRQLQRVETFVSNELATPPAASIGGEGLELVPLTAPTDLAVGDTTRFRLLLDGRPDAGAAITVIRGGNRYRYQMGELAIRADAAGEFAVTWPEAGRWWLGVSHGGRAGPDGAGPPAPASAPARRDSYSATFEVLPR